MRKERSERRVLLSRLNDNCSCELAPTRAAYASLQHHLHLFLVQPALLADVAADANAALIAGHRTQQGVPDPSA